MLVSVGVILYIGIRPRLVQAQKLHEEVAAARSEKPTVSVVTLKPSMGSELILLPANLQPIAQTTINARMSGYVKARYVDIGSRVGIGEVLADIESPETDQQLRQSQSEVLHAQAGVGQAHADLSRLEANLSAARSQVTVSEADLGQSVAYLAHLKAKALEASSAVDVAKAKLTQTQERLVSLKAELQRAKVGEGIARKTLFRWKELEKSDAVSGQDVDEKQSEYDTSLAKVDAARADVNSGEADAIATQAIVRSQLAELSAAQADVRSGEQRVAASKATVQSARSNLRAAQAACLASQSNIAAASATVGASQANVQRYASIQGFEHVTAPFSGVITARNVDVGDLVNSSSGGSGASDQTNSVTKNGLFGLARTDSLLALTNVPEDSISGIHVGQSADIEVQELPHQEFSGTVFHIAGALDATSRTLLVEIKIPNPAGTLKPGMYAQIKFHRTTSLSAIRIPSNALMFDARGTRVMTVSPTGIIHFITVTLGRDFGGDIEVRAGLKGTESIVTNPDDSLSEGQEVRVVSEQSKL